MLVVAVLMLLLLLVVCLLLWLLLVLVLLLRVVVLVLECYNTLGCYATRGFWKKTEIDENGDHKAPGAVLVVGGVAKLPAPAT